MSGPTTQRTFTRAQLDEAAAAWAAWEAEAGAAMIEEWIPWRRLAGRVGIIGPPAGSKWDAWTDEHPSQLAILTRSIRQTPELLREALLAPHVHSWFEVIAVLLRSVDELAARVEERNRREGEAWARAKAEEAAAAEGALERLGWSDGAPDVSGFGPPPRGDS